MAEENEPEEETDTTEEPSMDEILGSIREILSDEGENEAGQEASADEAEPKPETEPPRRS